MRTGAGTALALGAATAPALAVFSPQALVPLFALVGLACLGDLWRRRAWAWPLSGATTLALGLLAAWALASALWAVSAGSALGKFGQLAGLAVGGLAVLAGAAVLTGADRERVGRALVAGLALMMGLTAVEAATQGVLLQAGRAAIAALGGDPATDYAPTQLNVAQTVMAILLWPAACLAWARGGRGIAVALVAGAALLAAWLVSLSTGLAVVAGGIVFAAARRLPRPTAMGLGVAVVALGLAAPFVARHLPTPAEAVEVMPQLKGSAQHRLLIWRFAGERVLERPFAGWGLNASRAIPGGKEHGEAFQYLGPDVPPLRVTGELLPLHPHNFALQLWLETGVVGLAAFLGLVLSLLAAALRLPTAEGRAAALAAMTAALAVSAVSYGIWQSWWLAVLWLAAALLSATLRKTGA